MLRHISALTSGYLQEALKVLACAAYAQTYMVRILHVL